MAKKPTQAPNNPFACESNAVKMYTVGPCCCDFLAVYSYAVAGGGASITMTPLTGNTESGLKYYRWEVYDKFGNVAAGSLDLANPSTPVVIDTTGLSAGCEWKIKFVGAIDKGNGDICDLIYYTHVASPATDPSGDSTPANYENVTFRIFLDNSDDLGFSFPAEGVELKQGSVLDLGDINLGGLYEFRLQAKKQFYSTSLAAAPVPPSGDVVASVTPVSLPLVLTTELQDFLSVVEIQTGAGAGAQSEDITVNVTGDNVQPAITFTINTNIV